MKRRKRRTRDMRERMTITVDRDMAAHLRNRARWLGITLGELVSEYALGSDGSVAAARRDRARAAQRAQRGKP